MCISCSTSECNSRMRNSRHGAVHYVCDNSSVQILQTLICFVEFSSCFQRWKQTFRAILTDTQPGYTGYILATPSAHRTTAPPPRPVMFCIDSHSLIRYMFTYTNFLIFAYIIIHKNNNLKICLFITKMLSVLFSSGIVFPVSGCLARTGHFTVEIISFEKLSV